MNNKKRLTVYIEYSAYEELMQVKDKDTISHFCEKAIVNELYRIDSQEITNKNILLVTVLGILSCVGLFTLLSLSANLIRNLL